MLAIVLAVSFIHHLTTVSVINNLTSLPVNSRHMCIRESIKSAYLCQSNSKEQVRINSETNESRIEHKKVPPDIKIKLLHNTVDQRKQTRNQQCTSNVWTLLQCNTIRLPEDSAGIVIEANDDKLRKRRRSSRAASEYSSFCLIPEMNRFLDLLRNCN